MTTDSTNLLQSGDTGPAVKALQVRLGTLGYQLDADGIYGEKTEAAVRDFQAHHELPADGIVGPMTRNKLRRSPDLAGMNAVTRLVQFNHRGKYVMGAGGTNPRSASPFTWIGAQWGSDCIGAVCWALGIPRSTPSFPEYEGDISVDSSLMDAGLLAGGAGGKKFFAPVEKADVVPGVLVAFPSIRAKELWPGHEAEHGFTPNKRVRIGHIGIVAGWDGLQDPFQLDDHPWDGDLKKLITIECRSAWPAVRLGRNVSFTGNTHYARGGQSWDNEKWGVRFMRFVA